MSIPFKLTLPIEKSLDGDKWIIRGVAAGLGADLEGMKLSEGCISGFVDQINTHPIPFNDNHARNTILGEEMGSVTKAWLTDDFGCGVEIELDQEHPTAQMLWNKLEKGKQFGLSVGGTSFKQSVEFDRIANKNVTVLHDVSLDEISVTTKPIWTKSFGTVIRKALDDSMAQGDTSTMEVETPPAVAETVIAEPVVPTISAPETVVETPVAVEKSVTTPTALDASVVAKLMELRSQEDALLRGMGLLGETAAVIETTSPAAPVVITQSEVIEDTQITVAKSVLDDLVAQVQSLKEMIPATTGPGVLVRKSREEELADSMATLSTFDRLRVGLAALHGESITA